MRCKYKPNNYLSFLKFKPLKIIACMIPECYISSVLAYKWYFNYVVFV